MSQEQAKQPRYGLQVKMTAEAGKRDELVEYLLRASRLVGVLPGCELYVVSVSQLILTASGCMKSGAVKPIMTLR